MNSEQLKTVFNIESQKWLIAYLFLIAIICISPAFLQYYAHANGLLLANDSVHYLSAAKSFRTLGIFLDADNEPYIFWSPLFPVILSLFDHPKTSMHFIFPVIAAINNCLFFVIINKFIKQAIFKIFAMLFFAFNVETILIGSFLWTELFFITLLLCFVLCLLKRTQHPIYFFFTLLFGFLCCMQRNAGVFFMIGACLYLLYTEKSYTKAFLFGLATTFGSIIWNIHAWRSTPRIVFSEPIEYFKHIGYNLNGILEALFKQIIPLQKGAAILLIMLSIAMGYILKQDKKSMEMIRLSLFFIATYLFFLGIVFVFNIGEVKIIMEHRDRLLVVCLPFFCFLFFRTLELITNRIAPRMKMLLVVCVFLWLFYPMTRTIKNARNWHKISMINPDLSR